MTRATLTHFLKTGITLLASVSLLLASGCKPLAHQAISDDPQQPTEAGQLESAERAPAERSDLARFVVQTQQQISPDDLRSQIDNSYGPGVEVERMFEEIDPNDDPDGMARMFRVAIPRERLGSDSAWDAAYRLESEFDLEEAEPDTDATLEASMESTRQCFLTEGAPENRIWSIENMKADQAWTVVPTGNGRSFGEGISVCHPDTGWSEHLELDIDHLDLTRSTNLLKSGPSDGRDPLDYSGPLLNPGHGTGTGTVIVSGHDQGEIFGVAPGAKLVPIRTVKGVVQVLDSDLARAINYSVDAGCEVVSMSLGGRAFFGLKAAIKRAVRKNVIVAAAAGNCVGFVVAPAAYRQTLAVAATNIDDLPWQGSSKGKAVNVAAPGEHVWTAKRRAVSAGTTETTPGQGTSFAVANTAGVAALWLAFHDREQLLQSYPDEPLQYVFRRHMNATVRVPANWDNRYGTGIVDAHALLTTDLPEVLESAPFAFDQGEAAILSAVLGRPSNELRAIFGALFGINGSELDTKLEELGPELVQLALSDPSGFRAWLRSASGEESGVLEGGSTIPGSASRTLRGNLQ